MGLFLLNIVFGFAAILLFLLFFGYSFVVVSLTFIVALATLLLNYFLQQGWVLCTKMFLATDFVKNSVIKRTKRTISFIKEKFQCVFKKKKTPLLLLN